MAPIGNFIRIAIQMGLPIVRAFATAYNQALANARKDGGAAAKEMMKKRSSGMTIQEATQILDLSPLPDVAKVEEAYKRIFTANEPDKGGSFYLQSKVYRAHEFLIGELTKPAEKPEEPKKK
ncbi:Pam16-domain-containing protein [Pelagophyceae sp. CCMP2097]|nr:Pam16-domain-containing protein [Pelagophyceae sp. CCMP2097]